jgi:hypothetical protein
MLDDTPVYQPRLARLIDWLIRGLVAAVTARSPLDRLSTTALGGMLPSSVTRQDRGHHLTDIRIAALVLIDAVAHWAGCIGLDARPSCAARPAIVRLGFQGIAITTPPPLSRARKRRKEEKEDRQGGSDKSTKPHNILLLASGYRRAPHDLFTKLCTIVPSQKGIDHKKKMKQ